MRTPNGVTATEVTRNRCEELAKDPVHLQRLIDFWPPENITHILAREQLARLNAEPMKELEFSHYACYIDNHCGPDYWTQCDETYPGAVAVFREVVKDAES